MEKTKKISRRVFGIWGPIFIATIIYVQALDHNIFRQIWAGQAEDLWWIEMELNAYTYTKIKDKTVVICWPVCSDY